MATAFDTAMDTVETTVTGYVTAAFPVLAAITVAFLGPKIFRRLANRV